MPLHLYSTINCGYAVDKREEYIFVLGGENFKRKKYDTISVYDIKENIFRTCCSIKCPFKGANRVICIHNDEKDKLLVFGFVKQCYQSQQPESFVLYIYNDHTNFVIMYYF